MKNPVSFASLRQFCERDNVTALRCEQGFEATMQDVLDDNPDISAADLKTATMCRMLEENLDYGPLAETDDEADRPEHPELLAARHDILDAVAEGVVNGEIVGMAQANRKSLSLALERAKDMGIEAKPKHYAVQVHVEMAFLVEVDAVSLESARDLAAQAARKQFSKYDPDALCESHKPDVFRATAGYITEKEK